MTPNETLKQSTKTLRHYGEQVAEHGRTSLLAAVGAARTAGSSAGKLASAVRPDAVAGTLTGLVGTARTQATSALGTLTERGAGVIGELRRQPVVRRLAGGAEQAVDTVEGAVETALEETAEAVGEASDEATSAVQKTAARTGKAVAAVEEKTAEAAGTAKETARSVAETDGEPAPAKKAPAKKAPARNTRARTAKRPDPTEVPAKSDD